MSEEDRRITALLIADRAKTLLDYIRRDASLCVCEPSCVARTWSEDAQKTSELEKLLCDVINLAQ